MAKAQAPKITPTTEAWQRFHEALDDLAEHGQRTPCGDPRQAHLWTADDPDARALAVTACGPCPLLDLCHEAAESTREPFGVWAAVDRGEQATTDRRTA